MVMVIAPPRQPSSPLTTATTCIICRSPTGSGDITAGSAYVDDSPAFACSQHSSDRRHWIMEWSLFDAGALVDEFLSFEQVSQL